jgi:enoyl-CoA hydratase/carnithine racemase
MFEAVLLTVTGPVATITMNRPKRRNAFNIQMYHDLIAALKQCEEHPEVAAVVLTGSGGALWLCVLFSRSGSACPVLQGHRVFH